MVRSFPIFCTASVLSVASPGGAERPPRKVFGARPELGAYKRMEPTPQLPRVIVSPMRAAHS
jgi:hypothetical protein